MAACECTQSGAERTRAINAHVRAQLQRRLSLRATEQAHDLVASRVFFLKWHEITATLSPWTASVVVMPRLSSNAQNTVVVTCKPKLGRILIFNTIAPETPGLDLQDWMWRNMVCRRRGSSWVRPACQRPPTKTGSGPGAHEGPAGAPSTSLEAEQESMFLRHDPCLQLDNASTECCLG